MIKTFRQVCREYDSDEDVRIMRGLDGQNLADVIMDKAGGDLNKMLRIHEDIMNSEDKTDERVNEVKCGREYWSGVAKVALKRFPELQEGESISVREIKRRLSEIRSAGYPVLSYSGMKKNQAWDYLAKIKSNIRARAERECPDVLGEVDKGNQRQITDVYELR